MTDCLFCQGLKDHDGPTGETQTRTDREYFELTGHFPSCSSAPRNAPITNFSGTHQFLSNFYPSEVCYDGVNYPTVEHAFQAAKTEDGDARLRIRDEPTPGRAKRAGRKIAIRTDWEEVKLDVMLGLLQQKFQDPSLREKLHCTRGRELVEGNNWHDTFWGVDQVDGGNNHLGILLMKIRDETDV